MNAFAASIGTGSRVLDDLAEVVGQQAALALAWEFRGERVYIPKDPAREPRIAAAIGADQAGRFCEAFWRTSIAFPVNVVLELKVRELAEAGMKKREIARVLKIREARVYSILGKSADDRQLNLL